jgi:phosphoribosylformimino-5-aminoimidazole carboxamide ribotide isomerase
MLIPSIDLQGGRVVQLVQGDKLAIASDDLDGWIAKFSKFPKVQLIDLDAAMSRGNNDELVRQIAGKLPCRVGGGVRSVRRAEELIAAGAQAVIVGSLPSIA